MPISPLPRVHPPRPPDPSVYRRRRIVVATVTVLVIALVAYAATRPSSGGPKRPTAGPVKVTPAAPVLRVTAAAWHLPGPVSRAVALAAGDQLRLLGGLGPANVTTPAIVQIDRASGQATPAGTLTDPVHDAAGVVLAHRDIVFGGGSGKVVATVQGVAEAASGPTSRLGALPSLRADLASVVVDGRAVIVGGYDGTAPTPDVLETSDGTTFTVVAKLPQPVRYPAVAALGQRVFVIGGELPGTTGDATTIQVIDIRARTATIAAHLPTPLSHAGAAVIEGSLYLFGGRSGGHAVDTVSRLDASTMTLNPVDHLPVANSDMAVATVAGTTYLLGGENEAGKPVASVAQAAFGSPPVPVAAGQPFAGRLLIADRGNNRLLLVDTAKNVGWRFPSATAPAPAEGFYFPDDAFFAKSGSAIITNEEDQHTIIMLGFPSGRELASYGHSGKPGSAPGYLNQPDDAYLLKDGSVTVADAKNCRLLFLNPDFTYQGQIGTDHRCRHNIPKDVAYPNGDTPLANGNFLVSEINGSFVDEVRRDGTVVWSTHLAITYPSDPQQIGPDLYVIADYAKPGGIYEFTRDGTIVWSYVFPSGEAALDHPSLAEVLPNGLICVNDDYRHRVAIIDPVTKAIVWQYGLTDASGTGPNQLNTPDGFDLLAPDNTTPTHPQTG
jgi:hypothetical protein